MWEKNGPVGSAANSVILGRSICRTPRESLKKKSNCKNNGKGTGMKHSIIIESVLVQLNGSSGIGLGY